MQLQILLFVLHMAALFCVAMGHSAELETTDPVARLEARLRLVREKIEAADEILGRPISRSSTVALRPAYDEHGRRNALQLNAPVVQFGDADLRIAARVPELRSINISGSSISDEGLSVLSELHALESLNLSQTKITDAGLAHLAGLKNLRRLYLRDTPVSDKGIKRLRELENLQFIDAVGTKVSGNGVMGLQTGVRGCRVLHRQIDADLLATRYDPDRDRVKAILDKGADADVTDERGNTLLWELAGHTTPENMHRHLPVVELLLARGADVNAGKLPVLHYVDMRLFDLVKVLVRHGAELDTVALNHAVEWMSRDQMQYLAEQLDDDEQKPAKLGYALAIAAAMRDDPAWITMLLERGAEINTEADTNRTTALHYAVVRRHVDVARLLVERGADVDAKMASGRSALHYWAVSRRFTEPRDTEDWEVGELLLKGGCDINLASRAGQTPLHVAINGKSWEKVRWLVEHGADVNAVIREDLTPLAMIIGPQPSLVPLFISQGAKVNVPLSRNVPLHAAVTHNNLDVARLLLEKGADVNAESRSKVTAWQIAKELGNAEMMDLLKKHGVKDASSK